MLFSWQTCHPRISEYSAYPNRRISEDALYNFLFNCFFRYDLVKLGVQVLEDISVPLYNSLLAAYRNKSVHKFVLYMNKLREVFYDMDDLLSTEPHSLLGTWLEAAKALGKNETEKEILEFNARNQITLWGPNGEIDDYANKNWANLVGDYYLTRWEFFFDVLITSFDTGKPFDKRELNKRLLKYGVKWDRERTVYATQPSGDAFMLTKKLIQKYAYAIST